MEIKFNTGHILTTEHPASHYQAGVLLDEKGSAFGPYDILPASKQCKALFNWELDGLEAGKFIICRAKEKIWSNAEIALMRRYLSQDPQQRYILPDNIELRCEQAKNHLANVMGDTTQGVHKIYWRLGKATVAVAMYEATEGKYTVDDYCDVIEVLDD